MKHPNVWLCVYAVKKDRASLLTKCLKKIWQRCNSEASLSNYIPSLFSCILPFLSHSFSCESCTHLLTSPLIISLSQLFSKRYLINYNLFDFLHVTLCFPFGMALAVGTRTPKDQQTVARSLVQYNSSFISTLILRYDYLCVQRNNRNACNNKATWKTRPLLFIAERRLKGTKHVYMKHTHPALTLPPSSTISPL